MYCLSLTYGEISIRILQILLVSTKEINHFDGKKKVCLIIRLLTLIIHSCDLWYLW